MEQDVLLDVCPVFLPRLKVGAGIIGDAAVLKMKFQIPEAQSLQIDLADKQHAVRPLQNRRRKHLAHRNVDVRAAVLKDGLLRRILKPPQLHRQIRAVLTPPENVNLRPLVKRIDHHLLNRAVFLRIQGVDLHRLTEDLLISFFVDCRNREGNDRKGAFLPVDGIIDDTRRLIFQLHGKRLLLLRIFQRLLLRGRVKRRLPEDLQHSRASVPVCLLKEFAVHRLRHFELPLHKPRIEKQRRILAVVIIVLRVRGRSGKASGS